ncbi:hypothetical protein H0H81_008451 [Sphagnurus paluster]|uniref:Uncharacterized protein n=1 Tax=Sphagnurus paluster TaxID=117069 RepID=A0A9P7K5F3_9AGAR|nr:hypothetical protein H0H81_008451 [Sphagnurus paluster]
MNHRGSAQNRLSRYQAVHAYSHKETQLNALEAILIIGHAMFEADHEVAKGLLGCGGVLRELIKAVLEISELMSMSEKVEMLAQIEDFSGMMEYGNEALKELISCTKDSSDSEII